MAKRIDEITEKQRELLEHLIDHVSHCGYQPSTREMADAFGVTQRAIIERLIQLERKGYIRTTGLDRAIEIKGVHFQVVFDDR